MALSADNCESKCSFEENYPAVPIVRGRWLRLY